MKKWLLPSFLVCLLFASCGTPLANGRFENHNEIYIKPVVKDTHWYERVETFRQERDSIRENSLIFIGNSIIEGYDVKKYFPDRNAVNRGVACDHLDGLIDRLDICLGDAAKAKLAVLIGINDIGAGRSAEAVKYLYRELVNAIIQKKQYEVYLHSILPTSPRWNNCPPEMIVSINTYIAFLAREHGLHYVDLYSLFRENGSRYVIDDYMKDGLHPNDEGYRIWTEHLNTVLKR
ncbi:hypothetical protein JXO52_10980 [bacterium]|nr:hypothetical protein [bacterium]